MQAITLHGLTFTNPLEVSPGIFFGQKIEGGAALFRNEHNGYRGYVARHYTPKRGECWRVDCWPDYNFSLRLRRLYKTKRGADAALIREGVRLLTAVK